MSIDISHSAAIVGGLCRAWPPCSLLQDFLLSMRKYADGNPPKKDRVWLRLCIAAALEKEKEGGSVVPRLGRSQRTNAREQVPERFLCRQRKHQGPPYKTPVIREALWDFFVDIRRSVASTISPKFLLLKARELAAVVLKAQRATGHYSPLPVINRGWLQRWRRDYGVVYRKPNCRYKCSKATLMTRLRAMWINNIKVRRLAERILKHDLSEAIFGIDEKPIHFNESGSKAVKTLEIHPRSTSCTPQAKPRGDTRTS